MGTPEPASWKDVFFPVELEGIFAVGHGPFFVYFATSESLHVAGARGAREHFVVLTYWSFRETQRYIVDFQAGSLEFEAHLP